MTAYGTVETAVEAMKYGANDYILKPFSTDLLERVILNLQASAEPDEQDALRRWRHARYSTQDPGMIRLLTTLEGVAASQATVLISGESGTGKSYWPGTFMREAPVPIDLSWPSTARRFRTVCWRVSCSGMSAGRLPGRFRKSWASLKWPIPARCFSMKSAK